MLGDEVQHHLATGRRGAQHAGGEPQRGEAVFGIQRGAFSRTVLGVLREAEEPMTVRDIAAVLMRRGGKDLDGPAVALVVARVRNAVPRMSEQLEGELQGRTTLWKIKRPMGILLPKPVRAKND